MNELPSEIVTLFDLRLELCKSADSDNKRKMSLMNNEINSVVLHKSLRPQDMNFINVLSFVVLLYFSITVVVGENISTKSMFLTKLIQEI